MKKIMMALIAAALFTSCTKTGSPGPAGTNGNANVHGEYFTISPSNWSWDGTNLLDYFTLTDNNVNSNIIDSGGTVNVFISSDNQTWLSCPYTIWGSPSITYSFAYALNTVQVNRSNTNESNTIPSNTIYAKVVTITASQRKAHPGTNWQDYNQVMAVTTASPVK